MTINYRGARVAAEFVSGIRGPGLQLEYGPTPDTVRIVDAATGQGVSAGAAPVPARPQVTELVLQVTGGTPQPLPGLDVTDALLWGEGAVEKFLFPYYASAAAWDAAGFLRAVEDAWYGYDGTVVQVCALAYCCGPHVPDATVSLARTLGVVFCETGDPTLRVLPLPDFVDTPGYVGPGRGPKVPTPLAGFCAATLRLREGQPVLGPITTRVVAEALSGTRDRTLRVLSSLDADGTTTIELWAAGNGAAPAGTVLFDAYTATRRPDRPQVELVGVMVQPPGGGIPLPYEILSPDATSPATQPDSFFWISGAVEKFLLPYYASVQGRRVPFFDTVLLGKWDGVLPLDVPVSLASATHALERLNAVTLAGPAKHDPVSFAFGILREALEALALDEEDDVSHVFGIIHMPRSEYIPEDAGSGDFALADRTGFLSLRDAGFALHTLTGTRLA